MSSARAISTRATPLWSRPICCAACCERSMPRPRTYGPRSLIRTTTERPLLKLVTRTCEPIGRVRDAAVRLLRLKISPLEVRRPLKPGPYHDAVVTWADPGTVSGGAGLCATSGLGMLDALWAEHPASHAVAQTAPRVPAVPSHRMRISSRRAETRRPLTLVYLRRAARSQSVQAYPLARCLPLLGTSFTRSKP